MAVLSASLSHAVTIGNASTLGPSSLSCISRSLSPFKVYPEKQRRLSRSQRFFPFIASALDTKYEAAKCEIVFYATRHSFVSFTTGIGRRQGTRLVTASMRDRSETASGSNIETAAFTSRDGKGTDHFATNLVMRRDPNCAVEAGRSKAKKGGRGGPGGKIERRPPPPQKIPRKKSESLDSDEKQTIKGARIVDSEGKAGRTSRRQDTDDDDDENLSRFLKEDSGTEVRRTKLVGGWGRDKSMQREVPVTSEAKIRGAKGASRSSSSATGEQKRTPGQIPPLPIDDPTVRLPDDEYINGPFGPYAWRGVCVGKPIEGNLTTTQVVFFSTEEDDEEKEDIQKYNYTVDYTEKVDKLNEDIGVQYYYVFARNKYLPRETPWKDWTLAAQLAIESGEELDQRVLFSRLTPNIQDIMVKCVAWVRPDLIYVRKPRLQLRLEAQDTFTTELLDLLNQPDTLDSYYGKFCNILGVRPTSSSKEVKAAYDALREERKLECLEHLLTQHPVDLLASARYDREARPINDDQSEGTDMDFTGVDLSRDTTASVENKDAHSEEEHDSAGISPSVEEEGAQQLKQSLAVQKYSHKRSKYEPEPGPPLRSAVRPFDYSHLVEEIATIHNILHGSDASTEWLREEVRCR
ncbi:hypothetical protein R1flu_002372 [Riccia fluitans]|uniref:Uncharacterized protein n=1 Tax=Riccia fluitans TaxID=41844 RepID=A0ABD1Y5X8_9MARC